MSLAPFPMSDTKIMPYSDTAPFPLPASFTAAPCCCFMRKSSANICDALLEESQGKSNEMNSEELHKISLTCAHHFLIYLFLRNH